MVTFFNLKWFSMMQCNAPPITYSLLGKICVQLPHVGDGLRKVRRRDLFSIWGALKVLTFIFYIRCFIYFI